MSATGAWPQVLAAVRVGEAHGEALGPEGRPWAEMQALEQRLSGLGRRLRWLAGVCGMQLLLMLLLDLLVYCPRLFGIAAWP